MKRGLALICVAAVALLTVAAAGAKSNDTTITGAGSTFVQPLVSAWTPALGSAFGYAVQYSGRRLRCRDRRDHEQAGRLRCLGCAVDAGSGEGVRRLRPDSLGLVRDGGCLQRSGRGRRT